VKHRLPGEAYATWFRRRFITVGTKEGQDQADGSWHCGWCVRGQHEDCILECGCNAEGCPSKEYNALGGSVSTAAEDF
jgi:hypothetical protein